MGKLCTHHVWRQLKIVFFQRSVQPGGNDASTEIAAVELPFTRIRVPGGPVVDERDKNGLAGMFCLPEKVDGKKRPCRPATNDKNPAVVF